MKIKATLELEFPAFKDLSEARLGEIVYDHVVQAALRHHCRMSSKMHDDEIISRIHDNWSDILHKANISISK